MPPCSCSHFAETLIDSISAWVQLYIGGEFVGGADIVEEMHTKGELRKMLST